MISGKIKLINICLILEVKIGDDLLAKSNELDTQSQHPYGFKMFHFFILGHFQHN